MNIKSHVAQAQFPGFMLTVSSSGKGMGHTVPAWGIPTGSRARMASEGPPPVARVASIARK